MSSLLWDYLRVEGKFYSPPTTDTMQASSGINSFEMDQLDLAWKPVEARRDDHMVDTLIETLGTFLEDRQLQMPDDVKPYIDTYNRTTPRGWGRNNSEADARYLVLSGAVYVARRIMDNLGRQIQLDQDNSPPGFSSKVDFVLSSHEGKKALMEIKATGVMNTAVNTLLKPASRIHLNWTQGRPEFTVPEKVLYKACVYMASHKARWLALTSHDKWVFFRLHERADGPPYVTFSGVEEQADNTRPFCAFLAMILAVEMDLEVESRPDMTAPLEVISGKGIGNDSNEEHPDDDQGESYRVKIGDQSSVGRRITRSMTQAQRRVLVSWSQKVVPCSEWISFCDVEGSDQCSSLGSNFVRLRLQCLIGQGSTGVVYEAKLDIDRHAVNTGSESGSHSFAMKTVTKGIWEEADGRIKRLYNEFRMYQVMEQARRNGMFGNSAPRCYGLFETPFMLALITDYAGESLDYAEWKSLRDIDRRVLFLLGWSGKPRRGVGLYRSQIFDAVQELHAVGIIHGDLEPRNVVRDADGTFKIIDFSSSVLHNCQGIRASREHKTDGKNGGLKCGELRAMWRELVHTGTPERNGNLDT